LNESGKEAKDDANDISPTAQETLLLFRQGLKLEAISEKRELSPNSVWAHIGQLIQHGKIELKEVITLRDEEIEAIRSALADSDGKLKPVFEQFKGKYAYEMIRCIQASQR
jgi:ATP-dependent DNA helicase RecQ